MLQLLFGIFVRSVEDDLEPSQTYDEVNKLIFLLLLTKTTNKRSTALEWSVFFNWRA